MDLETKVLYEFGSFRLDPAEHLLLRDGRPLPLSPKAFELLLVLVEKPGKLLTKEELMGRLWPDSFVEEANLTVNISALRKSLGETTDGGDYIETVPKRGYRFVIQVREVRNGAAIVGDDQPRTPPPPSHQVEVKAPDRNEGATAIEQAPSPSFVRYMVLVLAIGVLATAAYFLRSKSRSTQPVSVEPRSLAILPFRNLKQDTANDFLGFSLADAVISKLDYVSALTVRPSYAIEKYRNQLVDIKAAASDLNVDTLLTGTFIRDGNDLRIAAQLVDVKTEKILWRDAFDLKYDKLLTVQDSVAQQIIRGLALNLSPSETERMRPEQPIDPIAYEYYLRGVDLYSRNDFPLAIKLLEKSAEIEPRYAPTWAELGTAYTANASFQFGGRDAYDKALAAYEKALALRPSQIEARVFLANLYTDTGRVEQAVPLLREALQANPNHAEVHWELGYAYRFAGMLNESVAECEQARKLDPGAKLNSSALNSYLYLGEYDKFLQSLPDNDLAFNVFYRGLANYYKKRWDVAAQNLDRAFELEPAMLQAQIGKALSHALHNQSSEGLQVLRATERRIATNGVGDPEAIYKVAQAFAVLGDKESGLRLLRRSVENGFFPYNYLATDPLLETLHNQGDFGNLLELARKRHDSFQKAFF